MNHLRQKKRGSIVLDSVLVVAILFLLSLIILVSYIALSKVNEVIQAEPSVDNLVKDNINNTTNNFSTTWDNLFIFCFGLLWLFVFIASTIVDTHPLFFGIALGLLIFVFVVAGIFSNTYGSISTDPGVTAFAVYFPKMSYLMNHLVEFIVAITLTTAVGVYGRVFT